MNVVKAGYREFLFVNSLSFRLRLHEDDVDIGQSEVFVEKFEVSEELRELRSVHTRSCRLVAAERTEGLEHFTKSRHAEVRR